ncbi:MAG: SPOR domain-containing protein [Sphingomicrobium sp.]
MGDFRSSYDDGELPWLEAVDDEDGPRGFSSRKMLAALLVVFAAVALIAATFFYLGRKDPAGLGAPELIRADLGPYKIKPADPGGLDVAGESETAFQTSAGEDTDAQLDLDALPEEAVARPPKAEPKPTPTSETKALAAAPPASPEPAAGPAGSVIQLGAYKNAAQAERAWTALSTRFPSVKAMTKLVVPYSGGFRLRAGAASNSDARQACQALRVAGENCFVAN